MAIMKLTWPLFLLAALGAGCASRGALPPNAAAPTTIEATSHGHQVAELRHFYLLSPGPNATLVVTRSDLSDH